jgi:hypothetical protein
MRRHGAEYTDHLLVTDFTCEVKIGKSAMD